MDNLTIIDTLVYEKRVLSHDLKYLKHVTTYVTLSV